MDDSTFSGWEDDSAIPEVQSIFFKFPNDKIVSFVLLGKPVVFTKDFGEGPTQRIRSNMVDIENPTEVKILELSVNQANELKTRIQMSETKQATILKCKKTGQGIKTKYLFDSGKSLTAEQKAKLAKLELHSLTDEEVPSPQDDSDEAPF